MYAEFCDADRRMYALTSVTISCTSERFDFVEKRKKKQSYNKNRQANKIYELKESLQIFTFGESETLSCLLSEGRGTLQHIQSNCSKVQGEGRFGRRHDQVLGVIAQIINTVIRTSVFNPDIKPMKFIRAGHKTLSSKERPNKQAFHWTRLVDLEKQLRSPYHILMTNICLDIVIFSNQRKTVMLLVAHKRKTEKYKELERECRERGLQATCKPTEVGARIFIGRSLRKNPSFFLFFLVWERERERERER